MQGHMDDFNSGIGTFLPGTASLLEEVDHKILVVLQDGRKLFGTLRSFDQYANLVLEHTVERIYTTQDQNKIYAERPLGLFLIRGDNVALLGVIDEEKEGRDVAGYRKVPIVEAEAARKAEREAKRAQWQLRKRIQTTTNDDLTTDF